MVFNVNPTFAAQAGFAADEVATDAQAILDGVPASAPVIVNDRAYTVRVRLPESSRASLPR